MINEKVLNWAFEQDGCPVCRIAGHALNRYAHWFLAQYYRNLSTLQGLREGGMCPAHAHELLQMAQPHHLVTIYRYLVATEIKDLKGFFDKGIGAESSQEEQGGLIKELLTSLTGPDSKNNKEGSCRDAGKSCPFCEKYNQKAQEALKTMAVPSFQPLLEGLFSQSDGLCLNHFYQLLDYLPPELAWQIAEVQTEKLEEIYHRLSEYERKLRVEYSHEPPGVEQDSWVDAALIYTGRWPTLLDTNQAKKGTTGNLSNC